MVCCKIQAYIDEINPSNTIYIAFDGEAPVAKLRQQAKRRALKLFLEENGCAEITTGLSTIVITPGTDFMTYLSKYVVEHRFTSRKGAKIIVSTPESPGEGEHKIFQYIRDNRTEHCDQTTIIYGLDSDLLMLSIFHVEYTKLYVFRETPEFIKSIHVDLDPGVGYLLDIEQLCESINKEINMPIGGTSGATATTRIHDYACLCFLLGNDFLPHIPTINIRIDGIQILMEAYRQTMQVGKLVDIERREIIWETFDKVLEWIEVREEEILIRHSKRKNNTNKLAKREEKYVLMKEVGWRERWKRLMGCGDPYKKGMKWVLKYYTGKEEGKWKGGIGKLIKEIREEELEEEVEVLEERESVWCEMKKWSKEERKGWKKYIWE
jgi:5'-3' exonuclease